MRDKANSKATPRWHDLQRDCKTLDLSCVWFKDYDNLYAVNFTYGGEKMAKLCVNEDAVTTVLKIYYPDYKIKRNTGFKIIVDIGQVR